MAKKFLPEFQNKAMSQFDVPFFVSGVVVSAVIAFLISTKKVKRAVCVINEEHSLVVRGRIDLSEFGSYCRAVCTLSGLTPGLHGLHVHRCGDLSKGCASTCDHYNPHGASHGGPLGKDRHRGDFGNIVADEKGVCTTEVIADVTLDEIVGRAFVIHQDEDDLGRGSNDESRKTGNAGKRIACGIIQSM
jgi:Cu/Zn superoxide dismutase